MKYLKSRLKKREGFIPRQKDCHRYDEYDKGHIPEGLELAGGTLSSNVTFNFCHSRLPQQ